ncbi:Fc.00g081240.m01.CDS01 [Cosmosporella sp. VM-42]
MNCCDEDQKCDSNGCIDPTETVTATTTVIKTESDKTTITVTSNTTVERTSTSESIEITTLSNVATATVLITKTKTITDSSSTVAKRWAAAIPDATPAVQDSLERRVDSLHLSNTDLVDEGAVVYLRAAPSLDVIADFLMARNITIQRRDTVTDTEWETETSTYVSTSTVVSTEWETEYTTSVEIDYVTRSSYIAADTTVTSTTTTTIHIAAGSTDTSGDDKKAKDDGSGDSDNSNSNSGNGSSGGSNDKGAIIGGAVGGAAGVVLLAVIAFLLLRRRKRSNEPSAPNAMPPAAIAGTHDSGMYGPPQSPHSGMQQVSPAGAGIDVAQDSRQDPKRGQSPWSNRGSSTHMQAHEVDAGYPFRSNINAPVHEADTVYPYERNNPAELDSRQQGDMAGTNPPRYGY